ncbi:MAG: GIY-YIG nuclease family protein [bacterium]|nr:GIY-YIG nuclease family protein [bacterium]
MYYVYILQSQRDDSRYIGVTTDLKKRLYQHNLGNSTYSDKKRPYKINWYSAFVSKEKAYAFEKYLKSSSGYAFTKKRLLT